MKVLILSIGLFLFAASHASALSINDPAPLFSLRDGSGGYFHLSDHIGQKNKDGSKGIIVNFFSSTCIPCKHELPVLKSLVDEFSKKKIKVVIIGYKEDFDKIDEMLESLKVDRPIILSDVYGKTGEKYGVKGLPITIFIGADGKVKDIIRGELPNIEKILRDKAGKLLK
ncbi:MAG: TlpA family protein disulfide reductase [Nitrospirae bacterium]|nr:TlpA family protein disulfide reductase [Nitrospirota bacterium]MCL5977649.1 TlpA family protein disulfide reductase [Nitrospirota bacterium]